MRPEQIGLVRHPYETAMLNRSDPRPKLSGQRNQCPSCLQLFNTNRGFDQHRTGSHEKQQRHCLSVAEMDAKGMVKNEHGFWLLPMPEKDRQRLAQKGQRGLTVKPF